MKQKISDFHLDSEHHWVADLECGHKQHMRHDPPWLRRPWILSEEGRQSRIGTELECKRCDEFGSSVAEAVRLACLRAAMDAYEDSGIRGLCAEGRAEAAWDAVRSLNLKKAFQEAITQRISEEDKLTSRNPDEELE